MSAEIHGKIFSRQQLHEAVTRHKKLISDAEKQIAKLREQHKPTESTRAKRTTTYARLARACEYRDRLFSELDILTDFIRGWDNETIE